PSVLEKVKFQVPTSAPVVKETESVKEEPKVEEVTPSQKEEIISAPESEAKKETPINEDAKTIGEGDVQVQVIGKIDLDKINTKTRPDKKKKQDYQKQNKEKQQAPVKPVAQKPVFQKPVEPVKEQKPEVTP